MRCIVSIAERRVCEIATCTGNGRRNGVAFPLCDVVCSDGAEVCSICGVTRQVGNHGHGFDSYNSFECEVGLVAVLLSVYCRQKVGLENIRQGTSKIVSRNLVLGNQ